MTSIARPSRRVRASATAMRYWGLRILPSRVSLILTAMMKRSPVVATLQFSDLRPIARIRFCLTCVTAAQAPREKLEADRAQWVAWQTAAHCARTGTTGENRDLRSSTHLYNFSAKCHAHAMDDAAALLEIEAIKQLKARYCRYLDTKDWEAWRGIFADDFHSDTSQAGGKVIDGADDFVVFTHKSVGNRATAHQVHAPEIELTSATTARARRRRPAGAGGESARLRPLPLNVREDRRAVAHHELQADPAAGGHLQRLRVGVPLRSNQEGGRQRRASAGSVSVMPGPSRSRASG